MGRRLDRAKGFDEDYKRRGTKRRIVLSFPPELFDALADEAAYRQIPFVEIALEYVAAGMRASEIAL